MSVAGACAARPHTGYRIQTHPNFGKFGTSKWASNLGEFKH